MLMLWPYKYKVGHIDLIHRRHHIPLKPPENPEFSYVSYLLCLIVVVHVLMKTHINDDTQVYTVMYSILS